MSLKQAVLLILLIALAVPVRGQTTTRIGIDLDNDFFASFDPAGGSDHEYTHGTSVWLEASQIDPLREIFGGRLGCDDTQLCHYRFSLSQLIYTPRVEAREPVSGERPHAGWLNASVEIARGSSATITRFMLQLGVVGPPALAEEVQSAMHRAFDFRQPVGWDHQLPFEPTVQIGVRREVDFYSIKSRYTGVVGGYVTGADLGNALTQATASIGMAICFGSIACSTGYRSGHGYGVNIRGSVGSRWVLRNIFLDGTVRESHAVQKESWVPQAAASMSIHLGRFLLEYGRDWRRREYTSEPSGFSFGSIRLQYGW